MLVMLNKVLALICLFLPYSVFAKGRFCATDQDCEPGEKCAKIQTSHGWLKHCVGPEPIWPDDQKPCTRNRDCDLFRLEFCIYGSCMTLPEYLESNKN